jgi:methylthioribose-1-phosphate isomerase
MLLLCTLAQVWNPSFDVAPGKLITGIVTEVGCIPKEGPTFKVSEGLCSQNVVIRIEVW